MPLKWGMGKNPYLCNYFRHLRIGPDLRRIEVRQLACDLEKILVAGGTVQCACGHTLDEHEISNACSNLLEPPTLAEELLLIHPEPPRLTRRNTPPNVLAEAMMDPERIALSDLELSPYLGGTTRVYIQKAFAIWRRQMELYPDDPLLLHHLAIMHHAQAFDLESGPKPAESDGDWETALGYWYRLHEMDAFWDNLTKKACAGTNRQDAIKKLRADFPQMVLAIHYDIALDKETREKRKSRAKFHIGMVHKAPFATEVRAEAQRAAYGRHIKAVPDEVWQPSELREEVLNEGQKAIVEYLNYDPGCIPALEDALRIQRRVQRSRNTAWRAMSEGDPKRKALLLLEKKDAEAWRPFFDQLAAAVEQLDEDVREDLARWHHGRGGDLCALGEHEKAIEFYERAVRVCRPEDDEHKVHVRELVQTMALVAREKAGKEEAGARAYCDKIRKRDDLTMLACYVLSGAYTHLSEYDIATALCDRGLQIEPDFDDLETDEWAKRLTEFKQGIHVRKHMSAARNAMQSWNPETALQPLNDAERMAKAAGILGDHNSIYWLRAQAYLAVDRIAEAKRDVDLYIGLLNEQSSPSDIEAGTKLREMVAAKEKMGNIKPLLEKAKAAMEARRFQDALPALDEAAKKAPRMDVIFFLRAQVLCATGRIADAQRDVKTVADLAETDEDLKHVQDLNEMIAQAEAPSAEFGGPEASKLRQEAIKAFNQDRYEEAISLLRQAIDASKKGGHHGGVPKLRTELSQILTMAAISMANAAQEAVQGNISVSSLSTLRSVIEEGKDMLEESLALDPSNDRASQNLQPVNQMLSQLSQLSCRNGATAGRFRQAIRKTWRWISSLDS